VISFSLCLLWSFLAAGLIIRTSRRRGGMPWDDNRITDVQKFHLLAVPRVGGAAIASALMALGFWMFVSDRVLAPQFWVVLLAGLPALLAGLAEDVTKRVGVLPRLLATMASGALAFWLAHAEIRRTDVGFLDMLLVHTWVSVLFTMIGVGGIANAINIIDGYNGLAAVVASAMFLSLAYVGLQVSDSLVVAMALASTGALIGFLVWNWPKGLIFLGDGGAYFIGYTRCLAGRAPSGSFAVVWVGAVHLPGLGDGVLRLAAALPQGGQSRPAGRPASSYPGLSAARAMGRGSKGGRQPHAAQQPHGALPVGAVQSCRPAGLHAVAPHVLASDGGRRVLHLLPVAVRSPRPLSCTTMAGDQVQKGRCPEPIQGWAVKLKGCR
jgi:UDP-N-acetylmuramyl pentapeptide phosphotransferase/UDP-N-acetylglucosamine-1-phosphate transferase